MWGGSRSFYNLALAAIALLLGGCAGKIERDISLQVVCTNEGAAAPAPIRRLTAREYVSATTDILGIDTSAVRSSLAPDLLVDEFDNNVASQSLTPNAVIAYGAAAEQLAAVLVSNNQAAVHVLGCSTPQDQACLDSFLKTFLRRVFRRPARDEELERYTALMAAAKAENAGDAYAPVAWVIEAALQSPNFLLRPELGNALPDRFGRLNLSGFELASRLSFFLWGTTPSDELLNAAEAGELNTREGVVSWANRLIADPRTQAHFRDFYEQWLHLRALETFVADTSEYPTFTPALRTSMAEEIRRLVEFHMWTEGQNFLDIYTTNKSYIDAPLAAIYGVSAPSQPFGEVTFEPSAQRGGLLSTAGVLALNSKPNTTSVVFRGKYVRNFILCDPIPPPSVAVIPPTVADDADVTSAFLAHSAKPECSGCHQRLDPVGLGLERYGVLGALRTQDERGFAVTMEGDVFGLEPSRFGGAVQLGQLVRSSSLTAGCVPLQLMRWSFGKTIDMSAGSADSCNKTFYETRFAASNYSFTELLRALVTSDAFVMRQYDP